MEKQKILIFDLLCAQPVGNIKFHGGGEYIKTVFKYLIKNRDVKDNIIVYFNQDNFMDDWIVELIEKHHLSHESVSSSQEIFDRILTLREEYKVTFFCGLPYAYRKYDIPDDINFVGVIHGLRDIEKFHDSKMFAYYHGTKLVKNFVKVVLTPYMKKKFRSDTKNIIRICDVLIVDSNHTKYSLKVNIPEYASKETYVFYPATQLDRVEKDDEVPNDRYLMLISANRWLKNSYRTVMAIDSLYTRGQIKGIKTYVYGGIPNKIKRKIKNSDKFVFFDYVSTEQLEKAYKNCEVFLYLTLNEGFGNVPMEAMKYGKTCVVSAVCSLPEVYQDTVYYCNPYDVMEIQNRILQSIDLKIDISKINDRLQMLQDRQIQDLEHLCDILLEKERGI